MIKVRGVTKKFGDFTALDGVDMDVNAGEIYGFIGPNGSGKSTTIRVLLGMLRATSGKAYIIGKDVWRDAVSIHRRVAYVPGDVHLWPNLTGGEVIDLFMKLRGEKNIQKREYFVERFQLDPTKKCRTYSKGNRQKVALVAALSSNADVFIFDEPTSGLDPLMEQIFQESILEASKEGKSILLSSHILSEVEKVCDQIGIIRQGKIIETGTMHQLRYLTRTNFIVETEAVMPALQEQPGIYHVQQEGNTSTFQVDTERLDQVVKYISPFGIVKLETSPPTLHDLFIHHYEAESDEITEKSNGDV